MKVGQESPVRSAEIVAVQVHGVLMQLVHETHAGRLAVHCVNHRPREGAVEPVNRARGEVPRACNPVRRKHWQTVGPNGLHLGACEIVLTELQIDLVIDWIWRTDIPRGDLMLVVAGGIGPVVGGGRDPGPRIGRLEGSGDGKRIRKRVQNERAGGIHLGDPGSKSAGAAEPVGGHHGGPTRKAEPAKHFPAAHAPLSHCHLQFSRVEIDLTIF